MAHIVELCMTTLCIVVYTLGQVQLSSANTGENDKEDSELSQRQLEYDPRGYVLFCLCMGRYGNQMDHFLGGMAFAKSLNRTLLLPPFTGYKNHRFDKWFDLDLLKTYHRTEVAEDFMEQLAPTYWPPEERVAFCWLPPNHSPKKCNMKQGSPFGPFWDGLGVDFVKDEVHSLNFGDPSVWAEHYPGEKYPVIALRGAPASFPVIPQHRHLQRYLKFTKEITQPGDDFVQQHFGEAKFLGLHMRNGMDWDRACERADGLPSFMASTQCIDRPNTVTKELCFPSKKTVLKLVKKIVKKTKVKFIFVATDRDPMIEDIEKALTKEKVKVLHMDPHLAWVDLHVLTTAHYFIGNCVSSFTAFVKRARDVQGKPTYFWGFD